MSEVKTYHGSCHCGAVDFEVTTDLTSLMSCNCSLCGRSGAVMRFVPAESFTLLSGDLAQTDYQFNKKSLHHPFCQTCGVRAFSYGAGPDGKVMFALNVRCLDNVDVFALESKQFDGKSL